MKGGALSALYKTMGEPMTTVANQPTTTAGNGDTRLGTHGLKGALVQSTTLHLNAHVKQKSKGKPNRDRPKKRQKNAKWKSCSYEDLVASEERMKDFRYPLRSNADEKHKDFITTPPGSTSRNSFPSSHPGMATEASECHEIVALDCEMCETARGSELTRMSLVDCNGEVTHPLPQ